MNRDVEVTYRTSGFNLWPVPRGWVLERFRDGHQRYVIRSWETLHTRREVSAWSRRKFVRP